MRNYSLVVLVFIVICFVLSPVNLRAEEQLSISQVSEKIHSPKDLSKFLKKNFKFVNDDKQFGQIDYWQTPEEFLKNRKGDCEDYALFSKTILQSLGYEAFVVSFYGANGFAHTVTVFGKDGKYSVMNEDRLKNYEASNIEIALSKIFRDWTWGSIARQEGTRGWSIRMLTNPAF